MKQQRGFTLIELVMVIVILGILAATAIPKFIDLSSDAKLAAVQGVAGALSSASAVNYASRSANSGYGAQVLNCTDAAGTLQGGAVPSGYTIASAAVTAGSSLSTCSVSLIATPSVSATFTAIGIN